MKRKTENAMKYREIVQSLDSSVAAGSDTDIAAQVCLAAIEHPHTVTALAKATGASRARVAPFVKRCKQSGIFKGGMVRGDWDDPEYGALAFWIDVSVAMGFLRRR